MTSTANRGNPSAGPLAGVRVVEVGGIGPVPFAGMHLAELGASVVRVERPGTEPLFSMTAEGDPLARGKQIIELDLGSGVGAAQLRQLIEESDVLLEGFRPGVMERLGFGPADVMAVNPRLIYGRMTGWGQSGPRALEAGHDINYISLTGALHTMGEKGGAPVVPLNLLGDFGGGSLYLVVGVLGALFERQASGSGRVIDAAIVDGVCHLMGLVHGINNAGAWVDERGSNFIDGGSPFYRTYRTADDQYIAVGAVEPKFYSNFLSVLGLSELLEQQYDRVSWAADQERVAAVIAEQTREAWILHFNGIEACVTPVLSLAEAQQDPHLRARQSLSGAQGASLPGPAPRFH